MNPYPHDASGTDAEDLAAYRKQTPPWAAYVIGAVVGVALWNMIGGSLGMRRDRRDYKAYRTRMLAR
jgi:hypothetical protein